MRRLTLAALIALTSIAGACTTDSGTATTASTSSGSSSSTSTTSTSTTSTSTAPMSTTTAIATTPTTVADPAPTEPSAAADCPVDEFLLEVNDVERDDGYADPELAVECGETTFTVTSNGMIAYEFVAITPNELQETEIDVELPLEPVEADEPGAIGLGSMGISVNGMALYAAFEAPQHGFGDPVTDGLLDSCNGHTSPAEYHYHARATCLFDDPDEPGLVYGYAFDGYPIIAPFECADAECTVIEEVASSYVRVDESTTSAFEGWEYQQGAGDLDECNGRVDDDGEYRYYVTDQFPYVPFCFHGETDAARGTFTGEAPTVTAGPPGAGPAV